MSKIRIAGVVKESITDGEGIRFVLFVQGCPHRCPGCHNPQTHDFGGGQVVDTDDVVKEFSKNPLLRGITFSGGEPFCQPAPLVEIGEQVLRLNKNITVYSGYTFEELLKMSKADSNILRLLQISDVLIDGRFELDKKSLNIRFRGSKNQRMIDLKKTLDCGGETIYTFE
ncbi:MAG TPA: anaerobic ribonucleoside-triphosphate reductase activating protein [Candidatus Monoglobus merdigallinarum]|uniref:Anaerobic ribonucleoside-triphosphate reductase-activating protein n=1 Tax=Candidatus Monoglobus merdigallinarum TaxID=2838698 RepID=A0A9D1PQR8_9FIRM|nr:anaerobic ribonucleoside-triphosphate reductase activating protein [Candidatus Monoglobus merdigallinarum]